MNRRASELLGLGIEEVQAIPLDEYLERLFGTDAEKMSGITDLMLSGHPQQQERRLSTPDGRELWVHVYLQLATVAGKNRILAILRDITDIRNAEREKKKLESQMQHAQKLESLGILAGGIAHDFNNILVGILGNADLALMDLPPEHPAYGSVKDIENSSRRASELVRQMLAYSGKGKFQTGMIDLSRVVEEMTHMLEVSVSKKAQLRFDLAGDLLPVECDVTQIRQVLMNLVINASESLESGSGLITIRTSSAYCDREYLASTYIDENLREGHYCCIEVSDTGSGIAPEIRSQLFDPFFTTKVTGRGLGLAAVLGIVRSHAGAISVYSEVGRGTTFKILLPAGEKTGREDDGSGEAAGAASTWKGAGTVLLVDDEQGVLQVGSRMLEKMGFAVLTAPDGFEAVSILRDRGEDIVCVILDLTMPRLDGAETLDEILKFDRNAKVILCSGYSEQDVSHRFVGRGFAGFMHKPYGSEDLAAVLKKVLGD
jgi:two-component system cell cycle sensor histidine kinase/response regulator CckA